ncbi:carbonic anhydrase 4 [Xenopus laevis]|uniref:Carbonic anhydrase n=1 Tax=Xenopus laevis TaxID=8355 RepID=A0A8J0TU54_XENLA|nr:carbonic anhydrase 4 [Xenopus laevis]
MWRIVAVHLILLCVDPITAEWCYTEESCEPNTWSSLGSCGGSRQSPIDIVNGSAQFNASLENFNFTNYNNNSKLLVLNNPGHTVEVQLDSGVTISGGGLPATYSALAFHFHWGNGTLPGSEHHLGGKQFRMEMHVVHTKNGMNLTAARQDPSGIAVLGFFIDVGTSASTSSMTTLANLLANVSGAGTNITLNTSFSIDSVLGDVDKTSYYRYSGSLTTPTCDEAVVWTIFKNPILIPESVILTFSSSLIRNTTGSPQYVVNNFRPLQELNSRQVQSSFDVSSPSSTPSSSKSNTSSTTPSTSSQSIGVTSSANFHFCLGHLLFFISALVLLSQGLI